MSDSSPLSGEPKRRFKVALVAIEPSADVQGGRLAEALLALDPQLELVGIGGLHMARAGVRLWLKTTELAAIGLGESFWNLPRYIYHYWKVRGHLLRERPDLTILIDCPAVNMRYAGLLRRRHLASVYYFPPSAWTPNRGRLAKIYGRTDRVVCTFAINARNYRRYGMEVDFFGHPLGDMPELQLTPAEARRRLGVEGDYLAILPGSRPAEVRRLLPVFLETAASLEREVGPFPILIPCANPEIRRQVEALVGQRAGVRLLDGASRLVLLGCRAALMSSGTASLEGAMLGAPMVLAYKLCTLDAWIARLLVALGIFKIEHIGLPSLVAGRRIVPEFTQDEVRPERLQPALRALWEDTPQRRQMVEDLLQVRQSMGGPGATQRVAAAIYGRLQVNEAERQRHPVDIVLTSNSPGEVSTWVKYTAAHLAKERGERPWRIVLALVPCPYASGAEARVASQLEGIDLVLTPAQSAALVAGWKGAYRPAERGLVVFLGGDRWHARLLAWRLGYPALGYADRPHSNWWGFRWVGASDALVAQSLRGVDSSAVRVVGNLSLDGVRERVAAQAKAYPPPAGVSIGLFPGSRWLHLKVALGVFLWVAAQVARRHPEVRWLLSVSPFITPAQLQSALSHPWKLNLPVLRGRLVSNHCAQVELPLEGGVAREPLRIEIVWGEPERVMAEIAMALTIPGTNTGELGCCGIPMVVGLSTRAPFPRGGLGGILEKLPGLQALKRLSRRRSYEHQHFAALPNRLAGRQLTPEVLVGDDALVLARPLEEWLDSPPERERVSQQLRAKMGEYSQGAGRQLAAWIGELVERYV